MLSFHVSYLELGTAQTHRAITIPLSTEGHTCHVRGQRGSRLATLREITSGVTFRMSKTPAYKTKQGSLGKGSPLLTLDIFNTKIMWGFLWCFFFFSQSLLVGWKGLGKHIELSLHLCSNDITLQCRDRPVLLISHTHVSGKQSQRLC